MSAVNGGAAPLPSNEGRKRLQKALIRLLGPGLLVLLVLRIGDKGAIWRTLAGADLRYLGGALALNLLVTHFKVLRWTALVRRRGVEYPILRAWTSFLSSTYVGMLTPGRVGDVLRAQYLRHDAGMPYAEGLAIVVMDRICDFYVLVGFVAVGVARFSQVIMGELAVVMWGGVALTALGPLILLVPGIAERLMGRVYQRVSREKSADGLDRFLAALRSQVSPRLTTSLALTLAAFLVNYAQGWLIARGLHLTLALYDVVCLLAIASLLGLLPISISGVGVRELFFALVFPMLGYPAETGVSYGLVIFLTFYVGMVALGFLSWQIAPPPTGVTEGEGPTKTA